MARFLIVFFFYSLLMMAIQANVQAQQEQPPSQTALFKKFEQAHQKGKLTDTAYLATIDSLTSHLLAKGVIFPVDTLLSHLNHYQQVAWERDIPGHFRVDYYLINLNNPQMANLRGAAMYFAAKVTQEANRQGDPRPLIELAVKTSIFYNQKNYQKAVDVYEENAQAVNEVLHTFQTDTTQFKAGLDALQFLSTVMNAYANLQDTANVLTIYGLASEIGQQLKLRNLTNRSNKLLADFALLEFDFVLASYQEKYDEAEQLLDEIAVLRETYKGEATGFIDYMLIAWRTGHYLQIGAVDSAATYVKRYENTPAFSDADPAAVNGYKAKLAALRGNYQQAYSYLDTAYEENGKAQSRLMEEIDNLLYAHTEAESNKLALAHAEKGKRQRTGLLIAFSTIALLTLVLIYMAVRRRNRRTRAQIEKLNLAANIQVAAMEEIKAQAVREEQKRLARDLHDGLSATLAGAKLRLELLTRECEPELAKELDTLHQQIELAYTIARGKSHQWYDTASGSEETDFKDRVQYLLDSALGDRHYTKMIHVDDEALANVPLDVRIDMLRIVQEALTNAIKHAKARRINILLYREAPSLFLSIKDDGKGANSKISPRAGIGIRSMKERAEQHGGQLFVEAGPQGTEVTAKIPIRTPA